MLDLNLSVGSVNLASNSIEMVREKLLCASGSTKESSGNGLIYIHTHNQIGLPTS
jgi:hypothetical protein